MGNYLNTIGTLQARLRELDRYLATSNMRESKELEEEVVEVKEVIAMLRQPNHDKWISVKDSLPETNLGKTFKHSEVVAVLTKDVGYPTTARFEKYSDGSIGWYDLLTDSDSIEVTHYKHLPPHPKK